MAPYNKQLFEEDDMCVWATDAFFISIYNCFCVCRAFVHILATWHLVSYLLSLISVDRGVHDIRMDHSSHPGSLQWEQIHWLHNVYDMRHLAGIRTHLLHNIPGYIGEHFSLYHPRTYWWALYSLHNIPGYIGEHCSHYATSHAILVSTVVSTKHPRTYWWAL